MRQPLYANERLEVPRHKLRSVVTDDPRGALARAAALFFGAQPETMVAVTGTNGKTSVSTFVRQICLNDRNQGFDSPFVL